MSSYPGFSSAFAWFADLALLSLKNKGALVVHRQPNLVNVTLCRGIVIYRCEAIEHSGVYPE